MTAGPPRLVAEAARRQLDRLHEDNLGRSKYQRDVREAARLALDSINAYEEARAAELEAVREEFRREVDRERQRAVQTARELEAEKKLRTNFRRTQETDGEGSIIRFEAPQTDHGHPRPWQLGELEQVLFDLRTAGAEETTEVRVEHKGTEARVPFPEVIARSPGETSRLLAAQREGRKPEVHDRRGELARRRLVRRAALAGAAAGVALFGLVRLLTAALG